MLIACILYVWAASHILHFSAGFFLYMYIHTHVYGGISWEGGNRRLTIFDSLCIVAYEICM